MDRPVRVRFAPSPTGGLHIGGVRTALYNYLFARQKQGSFIIRIEDTDQNRFVKGAEEYIFEALAWVGIEADESPLKGGPFAPYRQSERKEIYKKYAQDLVEKGYAYYAFDTQKELETKRKNYEDTHKSNFAYNASTRLEMKNSLSLSAEQVKTFINQKNYVIRLKIPENETVIVQDLIRGEVHFQSNLLDDKVLIKADGFSTYHLANVVDDYLMQISHVIRGEEWLPSAPLHVLLYRYLGWENAMPFFAHLPLLLNPDGKGKLSKRKGKEYGFPVFLLKWKDPETKEEVDGFRESGYLSEAIVNFLALLGWNPGTDQEIFSMEELIKTFSLDKIHSTGAKFDIEKAKWFNQHYLKQKSGEELVEMLYESLQKNEKDISGLNKEKALQICLLMIDRATFTDDLWKEVPYLFRLPESYDTELIRGKWNAEIAEQIQQLNHSLQGYAGTWTAEAIKTQIHHFCEEKQFKMGKLMQPLRFALTGATTGPDLMGIVEFLGKEEVNARILSALEKLNNLVDQI